MGSKTYFTKKKKSLLFAKTWPACQVQSQNSKVEVPKSKLPLLLYATQKNKPTLIKKCQMTHSKERREPCAEEL